MQAVDTGSVIWNQVFGRNAEALYAKIPENNLIKQTLLFRADPNVKRIVFVCVPHRGSGLATGLIGALGNGLMRAPRTVIVSIGNTVGDSLERLTGVKMPTSIRGLSPRSPVLIALDNVSDPQCLPKAGLAPFGCLSCRAIAPFQKVAFARFLSISLGFELTNYVRFVRRGGEEHRSPDQFDLLNLINRQGRANEKPA